MYQWKGMGAVVLLALFFVSLAAAQQEPPGETPSREPPADMSMQDGGEESASGDQGSMKMEHMADAMTSMAKTCDTMMKREMQMAPFKMAALGILGALGAAGLLLLVVLEVQWIRLLGLRIGQAKRDLGELSKR